MKEHKRYCPICREGLTQNAFGMWRCQEHGFWNNADVEPLHLRETQIIVTGAATSMDWVPNYQRINGGN